MEPAKEFIIQQENMYSGAMSCRGCGWTLLARYISHVIGQNTVYVVPACCFSIIAGPNPMNLMKGTVVHTLFAAAAATATGVRHALDRQGKTDTSVVVLAGDGGTFDIGLQALSGAAARQENIIYICNNNAAYMNTGVQSSTGTPSGAKTATDPSGKKLPAKNLMGIIEAHHLPYYATASPAFLNDLVRKLEKARDSHGFRFLMIDGPCPPGHKHDPELSIELARLAVDSNYFPLFESENGEFKITYLPPKKRAVTDYLKPQGRFSQLFKTGDMHGIEEIQRQVDDNWQRLLKMEEINTGRTNRI
jgi:pyruvate/2-oxoacid:ferredoxin oxidoreductase beta subunit